MASFRMLAAPGLHVVSWLVAGQVGYADGMTVAGGESLLRGVLRQRVRVSQMA